MHTEHGPASRPGPPSAGTVGALLLCDEAGEELLAAGQRSGLECGMDPWDLREPVPLDAGVRDTLLEAISERGFEPYQMPSGAGHDAMVLAKRVPAGMIFVPSIGGISHSPREQTNPEDAALGAEVLLRAVVVLDGQEPLPAGRRE